MLNIFAALYRCAITCRPNGVLEKYNPYTEGNRTTLKLTMTTSSPVPSNSPNIIIPHFIEQCS
jgi:hypothetical protein